MKPVIGVTIWKEMKDGCVYEKVNECNTKAFSQNGGVAVMLPNTSDDEVIDGYLEMLDGICFTGGGDINPLLFDEEPVRGLGNIEYDRDDFEMKLYKKAAEKNIPMIGICRGMQIMNVAAGGTVYQDIYSQRPDTNCHSPKSSFGGNEYHSVTINSNSKLYNIFGTTELKTNSYHHQSVKDVADGYEATAFAKDGIIECIESNKLNFAIGVQWHPEAMYTKYPLYNKLFQAFIKEASNYRNNKI